MVLPMQSSPFLLTVKNVHNDDIHAICKLSDGSFISGSKDTSVKRFTPQGKLIKVLSNYPHGYNFWITALDVFSDNSWILGQRNGYLKCADLAGRIYVGHKLEGSERDIGKERNDNRICSLKCQELYRVFIGQNGRFIQYDCDANKVVRTYEHPSPDWFYGFCCIDEQIVAIHGTSLSVFRPQEHDFALVDSLITYDEGLKLSQKPFISSILPMPEASVTKVALSFFGGEVQVFDLETKTPVFCGIEHKKRVWQTVPYTTDNFVSSADDGLIKIWDIREASSIHTIKGHPGRVSALCFLSDTVVVAGTCSEEPHKDPHKAQFFFYDLRRL